MRLLSCVSFDKITDFFCNSFNKNSYVYLELQVEKYYSVVGILEKWNESLEVMEHYIPFISQMSLQLTNFTCKISQKKKPKTISNQKCQRNIRSDSCQFYSGDRFL